MTSLKVPSSTKGIQGGFCNVHSIEINGFFPSKAAFKLITTRKDFQEQVVQTITSQRIPLIWSLSKKCGNHWCYICLIPCLIYVSQIAVARTQQKPEQWSAFVLFKDFPIQFQTGIFIPRDTDYSMYPSCIYSHSPTVTLIQAHTAQLLQFICPFMIIKQKALIHCQDHWSYDHLLKNPSGSPWYSRERQILCLKNFALSWLHIHLSQKPNLDYKNLLPKDEALPEGLSTHRI